MISVLTACLLACTAAVDQQAAQRGQQVAQRERAPAAQPRTPSAMGLQGYSVVLVTGDMQATGGSDTVPPAARKALTDMQAFLPYKRYQLTDAAWTLCCGGFHSPVVGRMRGPDDREYSYFIDTLNGTDDGKLTIRFWMRDADAASGQ
jgi:hypothetical protein